MKPYLLIARINGSSSSRRQRGFDNRKAADAAINKWKSDGFTVFWLYGQAAADRTRPLLIHKRVCEHCSGTGDVSVLPVRIQCSSCSGKGMVFA